MSEPNRPTHLFQSEPLLQYDLQDHALKGDVEIETLAQIVEPDDARQITRAIADSRLPPIGEGVIEAMCELSYGDYLLPVSDRTCTKITWPTITTPAVEELRSLETQDDRDEVLELLRGWRDTIDRFASKTQCPSHGWIGGIWLPHPMSSDVMVMRWPWHYRPYRKSGRPGDTRFHDLFEVNVEIR
jgi:hypothetical protein